MALLAGGGSAQLIREIGAAGPVKDQLADGQLHGARLSTSLPFTALFQSGDGQAQVSTVVSEITGSLAVTETGTDTFSGVSGAASPIVGNMASSETGTDTAIVSGKALIKGSLLQTETGTDTTTVSGKTLVKGTLSRSETGTDTFAGTSSAPAGRTGTLAAAETGNDVAVIVAKNIVRGSLARSETGTDTATIAAKLVTKATFAVTELGSDFAFATGKAIIRGSLSRSESVDTSSISGKVLVKGAFNSSENSDTTLITGKVLVRSSAQLVETGLDSAIAIAKLRVKGGLVSAESGVDTAFVVAKLIVRGNSNNIIDFSYESRGISKVTGYSDFIVPISGQAYAIKVIVSVRKTENFITSEEPFIFVTSYNSADSVIAKDSDYLFITETGPV